MSQKPPLVRRLAALLASALAGGALYFWVLPFGLQTGWAVTLKLKGEATVCPWSRVLTYYSNLQEFARLNDEAKSQLTVLETDETLGLQRVSLSHGPFWVRRENLNSGINYLFAEHDWIERQNPGQMVRPGDIVLDIGAHVGVFVKKALDHGAGKVVAVEPDPGNLECLRRNFAQEIAAGRVVLVPEGAWDSDSTMTLYLGKSSGWNSMMEEQGGSSIEVPVRKIDDMVRSLGLPRVDYIKMDIEGAERKALEGAMETLKSYRPRLMIDSYHRPDDMDVLPGVIRRAHSDYLLICGPCQSTETGEVKLVPHVSFYL